METKPTTQPPAPQEPKKSFSIRKDTASALRTKSGLRSGLAIGNSQPPNGIFGA
jgi:hypothetical protein